MLRTALRRSGGLYAVPVLLVIELFSALTRRTPYVNELRWAANWTGSSLILLGPVVVGIAAASSVAYNRAGSRELLATAPRGGRDLLALRMSAMACYLALVHSVAVVVIVALTWTHTGFGLPPVGPLVVPFLFLTASATIGGALGWFSRSLLVAPTAVVGMFAVGAWLALHGHPLLLTSGGATSSLVGAQQRTDVLALQAVWAAGLVGSALLVPTVVRRSAPDSKWFGVGVLLATTIAGTLLWRVDNGLQPAGRPEMVCTPAATQVCVVKGYDEYLAPVSASILKTSAVAQRLGVPLPTRWEQQWAFKADRQTQRSDGQLGLFAIEPPHPPSRAELAEAVVVAASGCPVPRNARSARSFFARAHVALAWLGEVEGFGYYLPPGAPSPTQSNARRSLLELRRCRR